MNTPSEATEPVKEPGYASAATPPFHRIPVRRGHFNHLALLAQEREQAKLGEQTGEVIARIDGDIRKTAGATGRHGCASSRE